MSRVSVVIPTCNRSKLLQRAIRSVINQTFTDWEIIVVDDYSTDDTESIIRQFVIEQNLSERLHYIRLKNRCGGAIARNRGIATSSGVFVAFLDDDDEWLPEKLHKQIECLKLNKNAGICYTGREIAREGDIIAGLGKRYSFRYPPSENHLRDIMTDNFVGITSSVIIPRAILQEVKGFDEKLPCYQDYDLFIRILQHYKAVGINEPLVRYYLVKNTEHVSFTREKVVFASEYMKSKYKTSPYYSLLKRALLIINLKKMIKSVAYAKEVLKHKVKNFLRT